MLFNKLKTASVALLLVGGVSGGAFVWANRAAVSPEQSGRAEKPPGAQLPPGGAPFGGNLQPGGPPGLAPNPNLAKNQPNLADIRDPIPVFGTDSILLVESPDGRTLEARSVESNDAEWRKLPIPAGLRATPIAADDTLALAYHGESINQISAFSAHRGEWSTMQLNEPIREAITPVLGPGSALFQAGNAFYAFSSERGAWGVLNLPAAANEQDKPRASISPSHIKVQQGDRLYVFSLKRGKWSESATMKLRPAKTAAPVPGGPPR